MMEDLDQVTRVLIAFAKNGFEKVTMAKLADAAGVTRQTLYNRYGSKEAILAWSAQGYSQHSRLRACSELNIDERSSSDCLLAAFSERVGTLVPLVHGLPHGSEILDLGTKLRQQSPDNFHADFLKELKLFLLARDICRTLDEAADVAFLLLMSAKGLLLNTRSREEFEDGMTRIIAAVLTQPGREAKPSDHALEDAAEIYPTGIGKSGP